MNSRAWLIAATVTGAILLVTVSVLTWIDSWSNGDDVPERTLVAVGAWSSYALAFLAATAGIIAWLEFREGRRRHGEMLAAQVRPLMVAVPDDTFVFSDGIRFPVKNIGVGPAISLQGKVWLAVVPEADEESIEKVNAVFDGAVSGLRGTQPHYELQASGLAVGDSAANWVRTGRGLPSLKPGQRVAIVYDVEVENVFEKRYRTQSASATRVGVRG